MKIEINKLRTHEEDPRLVLNLRQTQDEASYDALTYSIRTVGLITNIEVIDLHDDTYYVLEGNTRLEIVKKLLEQGVDIPGIDSELPSLEAVMKEGINPYDKWEVYKYQSTVNLKANLTLYDRGRYYRYLKESHGLSLTEISGLLGVNVAQVHHGISVAMADLGEVEDELSFNTARVLVTESKKQRKSAKELLEEIRALKGEGDKVVIGDIRRHAPSDPLDYYLYKVEDLRPLISHLRLRKKDREADIIDFLIANKGRTIRDILNQDIWDGE